MKNNKIIDLFSLKNKNIIITGAAGMLGQKHSEAITAAGGLPIMLDLNISKLKEVQTKIYKEYNIKPIIKKLDITNEMNVKKFTKEIINKVTKIDGLINNAAKNPYFFDSKKNNPTRLENYSLKNWNDDLNISLTGSFICSKYFGYEISKNKNGGVILNISSDLGVIAPDQRLYLKNNKLPNQQSVKPVSYSVTKFGIIGLTKYLSTYWPKKVRCNVMCPGGVKEAKLDSKFIKKVIDRIPSGRMADKNEYQASVIYLMSDASSYLNGAIIPIDGGRTAW